MTTMDNSSYYDYFSEPLDKSSVLNPAVMATIYYVVFAIGLLGNLTVLWVLVKVMHLRTMTDVCLLNLALSDLLTVLSLPAWALYNQGHHLSSSGMCKLMAGAYNLGFYSGILFVMLLSVDRYLAIVHAVASLGARNLRSAITVSIVIWIVSFSASLPSIIFYRMNNTDTPECLWDSGSSDAWKMFRNFSQNTVGLFISLPITIYCYFRILLVLRRTKNSKRGRAMKLIFAIVGVFVIFWVPYNVAVFLQTLLFWGIFNSHTADVQISTGLEVTETIALVHCCVNPVIYAFVGEKFRKCLAKVFSKWVLCAKVYQSTSMHSKTSDNETSNTPL
ncbi:C-C chemokine receptor type 4 [Trichomycterus rosablanca]|uniref:C-C chemokine receptor type 4 n=1 Tax=Trichomycterus rosablanca TaxID=2290929 RepID=UPI002F353A0A